MAKTKATLVRPPNVKRMQITVFGTTGIVHHKFSSRVEEAIAGGQDGSAPAPKKARNPKEEFLDACEVMPGHEAGKKGCQYAVKAVWFKCCAVRACPHVGMQMSKTKGAFFIDGVDLGYIPMEFEGEHPVMRTDPVRLPPNKTTLRYRPEFQNWKATLPIRYNANAITPDKIITLLQVGGFSNGVGDNRPQQGDGGGSSGCFDVDMTNVLLEDDPGDDQSIGVLPTPQKATRKKAVRKSPVRKKKGTAKR